MFYYRQQEIYDRCAGNLFSVFLILNILNLVIKQTFADNLFIAFITPAFGLVYVVLYLRWRSFLSVSFRSTLMMELFFTLFLGLSLTRNIDVSGAIIRRTIWTLCFCIPLASISFFVKDYKVFLRQTLLANNITFVLGLYSFIRTYYIYGHFTYDNYNPSVTYSLLLPLFFHAYYAKEKKYYWIITATELLIIAVYGSRGQLLCIALYIGLIFLKCASIKQKTIIISVIAVASLIVSAFVNEIVNRFSAVVGRFGSRTLSMLLRGNMTYDSGRSEIIIDALEKVKQSPFLGLGIAGELSYLKSYPHNLFVELLVHFGLVMGTMMIVVVICLLLVMLFGHLDGEKELYIIMASSVLPLLLSSTYLQTPGFWITVAMILSRLVSFDGHRIVLKRNVIVGEI